MATSLTMQCNDEEVDWTHVRETIRMLFLAIAQIEIALSESDDSIDHLTEAFTSMVGRENEIARSIDQLSIDGKDQLIYQSIKNNAEKVTEKMQTAIVAFQFYDKLTQRLAHVGSSMEELSELLDDDNRISQVDEWRKLQADIKSRYSMREEYELFNAVMAGGDIREAIRRFNQTPLTESQNDIELF